MLAVLAALVLTGCGGSGSPATTSTTAVPSSASTTATNANVRLAATFIIRAAGRLFPSEVAAPTHTTIVLTVRAGDSRRHEVTVVTPHPHTGEVAPGRPERLVLEGVPDGTYAVKVDGERRGSLIVGAQPGP